MQRTDKITVIRYYTLSESHSISSLTIDSPYIKHKPNCSASSRLLNYEGRKENAFPVVIKLYNQQETQ